MKKFFGFFIKSGKDQNAAHASSAAFFIFLSIFPLLMILCSILPYTPLTIGNIISALDEVVPDFVNPIVHSMVNEAYSSSIAVFSFSIILALWSSAKGMMAVVKGLNAAEEVTETRNYFRLRLRCIIYTVMLVILMLLLVVAGVFGRPIVNMIVEKLPKAKLITDFILNVRYVFSFALLIIVFSLMYTYLPNKKNNFVTKIPGALFTALGWILFSWGFSVYISYFGNFSMYGSLTTLVLLMLWLYFCMTILLLGAEINIFLHDYIAIAFVRIKYRKSRKKEKVESKESKNTQD